MSWILWIIFSETWWLSAFVAQTFSSVKETILFNISKNFF